MFYNTIEANEDQIEKILKKHLFRVKDTSYTYDDKDGIGYIHCYSATRFGGYKYTPKDYCKMTWQLRGNRPMFFSLHRENTRYDIYRPEGMVLERLIEISKKAVDKWEKGQEI